MDSCCSTGKLCNDDFKNTDKCFFEGKEYFVGQKMYPKNLKCHSCLCVSGFDNSTIVGNPNCKEVQCGFYLHYSDRLYKGCIPVYYGDNTCCPIDWRCRKCDFVF